MAAEHETHDQPTQDDRVAQKRAAQERIEQTRQERLRQLEQDLRHNRRREWRRPLLAAGVVIFVLWLVVQLIPLEMDNPRVVNEPDWSAAPPEVRELAVDACFDCHSHETDWPWYAQVAPMRLYIWNEVREGRAAMNFSDWEDAPASLDEIENQIDKGLMPPWTYTLGSREARLSDAEKERLIEGLRAVLAESEQNAD
ncbi:MAG: heme-binding domain-containing protein [Chloroflexi bacterium]|nr:heme-binding domain-containing protein [Chloroflexota bacterium]